MVPMVMGTRSRHSRRIQMSHEAKGRRNAEAITGLFLLHQRLELVKAG